MTASFSPQSDATVRSLIKLEGIKKIFFTDEVETHALADIVRSKEAAGREKDVLALPVLERHLRARRDQGDEV